MATVTGQWLDSQVSDGNSWFTIGLLLLSVPIVLYLTIRLALRSTRGLSSNTVSEIEEDEEFNSDDRIT
ncbi:MAG TPA: hypothetical protein QF606_04640 [Anaerolineales bacterium]|nr:hypothetical protein [Anaerolineales bacterium]